MRPLFTELIHPAITTSASVFAASASVSDTATSAFITEETANDESNDIPHSQQYLQFLMRPQGLSNSDFRKFMQYSSGFFFSNGKLWRHNTHRRHKIVVPKEKRYELLKEVHDILGHKTIYAMRMQLLERFW
jgi:hypothetical protein